LLSRNRSEPIDAGFFQTRIAEALYLRSTMRLPEYGRLVAGEADYLPGLIVDQYGKGLVFQTLALGMDRWKGPLIEALVRLLQPDFIVERNDARVRLLEGLPLTKRLAYGVLPDGLTLNDSYVKWQPDLMEGPNTGVYWEQFWLGKAILPYS